MLFSHAVREMNAYNGIVPGSPFALVLTSETNMDFDEICYWSALRVTGS